jgi:hypothetical protein
MTRNIRKYLLASSLASILVCLRYVAEKGINAKNGVGFRLEAVEFTEWILK